MLGLGLEAAARAAITDHVRLLLAWSSSVNLTAIRDPAEIARLHVVDSLAALPTLRELGVRELVDVGSGAGFPGIPLAVALDADRALLVESVGKKAAFLDAAVVAAGLAGTVAVHAGRAEALAADPGHCEGWGAVTARAVAELADLVEVGLPILRLGGHLIAWKGAGVEAELPAAERAAGRLGGGRPRVIRAPIPGGPEHRLVVVEKVAPTPDGYPRDPAVRRRRPW